jgi:hypothetical protein
MKIIEIMKFIKNKVMKNLHVIPTDKPSSICQNLLTVKWFIPKGGFTEVSEANRQYYHIYITSDEEIKDGDWIKWGEAIYKANKKYIPPFKKIILTTDQDLIADGVQAIDDEFLEWFVNNPSCEEVKIEDYGNLYNFRYLILIPREETKTTNDVDINQRSYSEEDVKKMLHMCCDVLENNKKSFWNIDGLVDEIVLTFKQQEQ